MSVKATMTVSIEPSSTAFLSSSALSMNGSLTPPRLTRTLVPVENRRSQLDFD